MKRMTNQILLAGLVFCAAANQHVQAQWEKHAVVSTRTAVNSVVANDFDGDGSMDVIASYDGAVFLLKGPEWTPTLIHKFEAGRSIRKPRTNCIHSCLMDADGDGDLDFCGSNNTVFWLECPKEPFSGEPWKYRTVDDEILGTHCLITGDVNQDGSPDLIANSGSSADQTPVPESLVWLESPGKDKDVDHWVRHVFADRDAPGGSHYFGFGDANADGRPDISCAAKGAPFDAGEWFAWWQQPRDSTAVWKKHVLSEEQPGATNIHPLDIDADGNVDFVAARGHAAGVLIFKGPSFEAVEVDPSIVGPHSLVTVDLDGDRDIDIATVGKEKDGKAVWYENRGDMKFKRHMIGIDQGCYDLRAVDMDADQDLDLLVAGHGSRNIVWYENKLSTPTDK